jgi:hypothetical protein
MTEPNCFIILFDSTHQALSGEKALKESGIRHAVINTPREFSVDCGISLRVEPGLKDEAVAALEAKGIIYAGVEPYRSRWK